MNTHTDLPDDQQFWQEHRQQLYYFVLKRVGDPGVAEDVVQEVLIKAYTNLDSLSDQHKFLPWLYQITRNVIADYFRKAKPEQSLEIAEMLAAANDDPTHYEELAPCILPLIKQLPSPYREAVYGSEIEGLPQKEIASRMGITLSGAKSQVQRGRKYLKTLLQECCTLEVNRDGKLLNYDPGQDCNNCSPS